MKIILASKSGVRKKILEENNISCIAIPSNVDEDQVKDSLLAVGANPTLISKNLAELKSIKISNKYSDQLVIGADSVISLNNEHDMRLRNIRARLIDFQHQSVFNSSFISLTIIIRDKLN